MSAEDRLEGRNPAEWALGRQQAVQDSALDASWNPGEIHAAAGNGNCSAGRRRRRRNILPDAVS